MKKLIIFLIMFLVGIDFAYAKETVKFSKCVDGDTIKVLLDEKEYTVRMLAVDTPESVHPQKGVEYYGKEASEYTCNKVKNAKKIEIEYDEDSDKMDKYDRLLVWVFTDGKLLQKELVANGYAKVAYLYGDYKYTKELEKTQELASAKNLGIWNTEALNKYNKENNVKEDIKNDEDENSYTTPTKDLTRVINKVKSFGIKDYIVIAILLIVIIFGTTKTTKNKAKSQLKKYLK